MQLTGKNNYISIQAFILNVINPLIDKLILKKPVLGLNRI